MNSINCDYTVIAAPPAASAHISLHRPERANCHDLRSRSDPGFFKLSPSPTIVQKVF